MKKKRKIDSLHLWKDNPRTINNKNFGRLKKQIQELGEYKPLIITEDGTVIGGNMRLRAYRELGFKECWVSVVKAETEAEKLKYALSDNDQVGEYQRDDLANLVGNLPDIDLSGYSVNLGKSTPIEDLMPQIEEDEPPEVEEGEPESKLGEVYQLGRHRLMCGDATKVEDVEKLMDGKRADMVFTDPPYGLGGYGGRNNMELKGDDVDVQQFYDAVPTDIEERYVWGNAYNMLNLKERPRDVIVWVKNNFGMGRGYRGQYELCFYWGDFDKSDSDVWQVDKDVSYEHPTQKPVALAERAIKNSSKRDDIVLDLFGGSGSTLIACEQTNRICYMMELDPKYCDVIRKRYENYKSSH